MSRRVVIGIGIVVGVARGGYIIVVWLAKFALPCYFVPFPSSSAIRLHPILSSTHPSLTSHHILLKHSEDNRSSPGHPS